MVNGLIWKKGSKINGNWYWFLKWISILRVITLFFGKENQYSKKFRDGMSNFMSQQDKFEKYVNGVGTNVK